MNKYILILLIILCWTFNPFIKRQLSPKFKSSDFLIYNHAMVTILIFTYFMYLLWNNKCDFKCLSTLNKKDLLYSLFGATTTVLSSIILINLLKEYQASHIIPNIQPAVIILTMLLGYFVFNEDINKNKIYGTGLIVLGLFVFNLQTQVKQ